MLEKCSHRPLSRLALLDRSPEGQIISLVLILKLWVIWGLTAQWPTAGEVRSQARRQTQRSGEGASAVHLLRQSQLNVDVSSVEVQSLLGHRPEPNGEQLFPGLPDPGQEGCQLLSTHNTERPETLQSGHLVDQAVGKGRRHRRRQGKRSWEVLERTRHLPWLLTALPFFPSQVFVTLH